MGLFDEGARGAEVEKIQHRLCELGYDPGPVDGFFGPKTAAAVRSFQTDQRVVVDATVGPRTWSALFRARASGEASNALSPFFELGAELLEFHPYEDGVSWRLTRGGVEVEPTGVERTPGDPLTVRRVWESFAPSLETWAERYKVPPELIVATICTESGGNPSSVRTEPGYVSDEQTPHRVSPGLMQTLISTARWVLGDESIDRAWLLDPDHSIRAGTAYIASQREQTGLDPPKVACAYNAGGVYYQGSPANRWKMRQFPIGSSEHADRFVKWFNDFYAVIRTGEIEPTRWFFA